MLFVEKIFTIALFLGICVCLVADSSFFVERFPFCRPVFVAASRFYL